MHTLWDCDGVNAPVTGLWAAYVAKFGEGMTQRQVGDIAGVDQATVGRWLRSEKVPTEAGTVAKLAQGFHRNPLEAFVAAGFLSVEEAGRGLEKDSRALLAELVNGLLRESRKADGDHRRSLAMGIASTILWEKHQEGTILGPDALRSAVRDGHERVGLESPPLENLSKSSADSMIQSLLDIAAARMEYEIADAARDEDNETPKLADG